MSRKITVTLTKPQYDALVEAIDNREQHLIDNSMDRDSRAQLQALQNAREKVLAAWYRTGDGNE